MVKKLQFTEIQYLSQLIIGGITPHLGIFINLKPTNKNQFSIEISFFLR
jgi:hypothetical protein|tara:strand:+ start:6903 stop:7049 length:147 start_codon:yes stop_codon:yes gene_type:complete